MLFLNRKAKNRLIALHEVNGVRLCFIACASQNAGTEHFLTTWFLGIFLSKVKSATKNYFFDILGRSFDIEYIFNIIFMHFPVEIEIGCKELFCLTFKVETFDVEYIFNIMHDTQVIHYF